MTYIDPETDGENDFLSSHNSENDENIDKREGNEEHELLNS